MVDTYSIKIPKVLKLKHIPLFNELERVDFMTSIKCISIISGLPIKDVSKFKMKDIVTIYREITLAMAKVKMLKKLPKEITILGQEYYLINPINQPISWVIDSNALVRDDKPEMVAAFMYLEKGTTYGEADEHENIKHSVLLRAEIFKNEFPINVYLTLIKEYAKIIIEINKIVGNDEKQGDSEPKPFGWENLIIAVGKEFGMSFHDTMKLNIKTFMHYTKVYFHNMKEKIRNSK